MLREGVQPQDNTLLTPGRSFINNSGRVINHHTYCLQPTCLLIVTEVIFYIAVF
jgi:hypothetical protein